MDLGKEAISYRVAHAGMDIYYGSLSPSFIYCSKIIVIELIVFTFWFLLGRVLEVPHVQLVLFQEIVEISPVFASQLGCAADVSFAHP
jgi:hypothetical protein